MKILVTGGNGFIGTNLIEILREYQKDPYQLYVLDIAPPKIALQENEIWLDTDIMDYEKLKNNFTTFKPDCVIHLAALTDCAPHLKLDDYLVNTKGSENVFNAVEASGIEFLMNTSTQFVNQSDRMPTSDTDYAPHTIYGESKIIAEKMLREGNYTFNWVITRPTNIWGKYHLRYPYEFWKVVRDGKYFHPGNRKVVRSYGYVGNICIQMLDLVAKRNQPDVSKKVFYVGDRAILLYDWVNSFSKAITGKEARIVPSPLVYSLALFGTVLQKARIGFPITLSRYRSMTSDNPAPMEPTFAMLGETKYSMEDGVNITTQWLREFWQKK